TDREVRSPLPLERPGDSHRAIVEVDVTPSQSENLALAQPLADGDHKQGFETLAPDRVQEAVVIVVSENTHLRVIDDGTLVLVHQLGDVAGHLPLPHRLGQRTVNDRM